VAGHPDDPAAEAVLNARRDDSLADATAVLSLVHDQHPTGSSGPADHVVDRQRHQPAQADHAHAHAFVGQQHRGPPALRTPLPNVSTAK
jgi:hypothetical protein